MPEVHRNTSTTIIGRFDWADPFGLADQLNEDQRMLADAARTFACERLQPRIVNAYRDERVEPEVFSEMGGAGLLGVTIPEEYGGLGCDYVTCGLVARGSNG
jgi:glutaryl-CoA dehydrogenase